MFIRKKAQQFIWENTEMFMANLSLKKGKEKFTNLYTSSIGWTMSKQNFNPSATAPQSVNHQPIKWVNFLILLINCKIMEMKFIRVKRP